MIDYDKISKEEMELISKIAYRAISVARAHNLDYSVMTCEIDLCAWHLKAPLDLERLLNANAIDFAHDVFGIRKYIDRDTYAPRSGNVFLPRCTAPQDVASQLTRAAGNMPDKSGNAAALALAELDAKTVIGILKRSGPHGLFKEIRTALNDSSEGRKAWALKGEAAALRKALTEAWEVLDVECEPREKPPKPKVSKADLRRAKTVKCDC